MSGFRKLPARYAAIVTPLLLSLIMSLIVSGISTVRVIGFAHDLPIQWLRNWGVSWIVAFPTVLVVLPMVRRMTAWIVEAPER